LAISDKYKYYRFARESHKLHNITLIEKVKQKTAILATTKTKFILALDLLAWISYRLRWLINRSDVAAIISTSNASEIKLKNSSFTTHINSLSEKSMPQRFSRLW